MQKILILAVAVLVAGCASLPPTIDRGEYQNYRYGFVVRLPEGGWLATKDVPEGFSAYLVPDLDERVVLLLYNPRSRGLIAVRARSLYLSYESMLTLQERLTVFVEGFLDQDWKLLVQDNAEKRGAYQVGHCDASGLSWQEKTAGMPPAGIRHASLGYVYPLKGESCTVTFYIFSEPDTFEGNLNVLYRMAGTFSSGEVFTTENFGW